GCASAGRFDRSVQICSISSSTPIRPECEVLLTFKIPPRGVVINLLSGPDGSEWHKWSADKISEYGRHRWIADLLPCQASRPGQNQAFGRISMHPGPSHDLGRLSAVPSGFCSSVCFAIEEERLADDRLQSVDAKWFGDQERRLGRRTS